MGFEKTTFHEEKLVTVVLPVRVCSSRPDALRRLAFPRLDERIPDSVGFVVVDDGSPPSMAQSLRDQAADLGYQYLRLDTEAEHFSVGRCRNAAAMLSGARYVFMQDIDLMPYPGFYADLVREICAQGIAGDVTDFIMVGVAYLTEGATEEFLNCDPECRRQTFLHRTLIQDTASIEKFSTGTSACLYDREYYLARGGNDAAFRGWGYEDLEFNTRLIRLNRKFPLPEQWLEDNSSFAAVSQYRGWKAAYRLHGDATFAKGIALFHAWHPVERSGGYASRRDANRQLFLRRMAEFAQDGREPEPLPSLREGRTLLFRRNAFTFAREMRPKLGEVLQMDENLIDGPAQLDRLMQEQGISRILFHNPYATPQMQNVYAWARAAGHPIVVAERGALPDAVFFDPTGFLDDGTSYKAWRWDMPLNEQQRAGILDYIRELRESDEALEKQAPRRRPEQLRAQLGILPGERVMFVALQRPGDSVVTQFRGRTGSYAAFLDAVQEAIANLPPGWRAVVKQHPLEDGQIAFPGAVDAGSTHVSDLLELCDQVVTFNSGVGVLAVAFGRHVMNGGAAFYADARLNTAIGGWEDIVRGLVANRRPCQETALRFLHYLVFRFYSFGTQETREVRMPDGSRMTATTDIAFSVLRGLGQKDSVYQRRRAPKHGWETQLMDRYRNAAGAAARPSAVAPKPPATQPRPAAAPPATSDRSMRKVRKLVRSPVAFFRDSLLVRRLSGAEATR